MGLFVRLTVLIALGIVALVVIGFVLKAVVLGALVAALIVAGLVALNFLRRLSSGGASPIVRR